MKNGITKHANVSVKIIVSANKITTGIFTQLADDKKVRHKMKCYTFHTVLLVVILLFIIDSICYH